MLVQFLLSALASFVNFGLHAVMTGVIIVVTSRTATATDHLHVFTRLTAILTITVAVLMVAHVVEVGVWAFFYHMAGVHGAANIPPDVTAFEFAFENYTALGYGDIVPGSGLRLFGPITALNGLLLIGWSVAIIFEVMRMADVQVARRRPRESREGEH